MITKVAPEDAGTYTVSVTAGCAVEEESAELSVAGFLVLADQPSSRTVCPGSTVTLRAPARGDVFEYEWRRHGEVIRDVRGDTYTIDRFGEADAAEYQIEERGVFAARSAAASGYRWMPFLDHRARRRIFRLAAISCQGVVPDLVKEIVAGVSIAPPRRTWPSSRTPCREVRLFRWE
ncbi:MAG: hypothetical protein U1G07_15675 [Verrucomicrobiota bacterium]